MRTVFKNKAFISYSQRDQKHARKLQRWLESYVVPKSVRHLNGNSRKLGRIFRDETDMSGTSDLDKSVKNEIDQAECLIVICSPNAANSQWVEREIEHFRLTDRADKIFAYIIEGSPNADDPVEECFPLAFRDDAQRLSQPLAMNPRLDGSDRARLRLVSGLLGTEFDLLFRRYRRDFMLTILLGLLSFSLLILILGSMLGITTYALWRSETNAKKALDNERFALENLRQLELTQDSAAQRSDQILRYDELVGEITSDLQATQKKIEILQQISRIDTVRFSEAFAANRSTGCDFACAEIRLGLLSVSESERLRLFSQIESDKLNAQPLFVLPLINSNTRDGENDRLLYWLDRIYGDISGNQRHEDRWRRLKQNLVHSDRSDDLLNFDRPTMVDESHIVTDLSFVSDDLKQRIERSGILEHAQHCWNAAVAHIRDDDVYDEEHIFSVLNDGMLLWSNHLIDNKGRTARVVSILQPNDVARCEHSTYENISVSEPGSSAQFFDSITFPAFVQDHQGRKQSLIVASNIGTFYMPEDAGDCVTLLPASVYCSNFGSLYHYNAAELSTIAPEAAPAKVRITVPSLFGRTPLVRILGSEKGSRLFLLVDQKHLGFSILTYNPENSSQQTWLTLPFGIIPSSVKLSVYRDLIFVRYKSVRSLISANSEPDLRFSLYHAASGAPLIFDQLENRWSETIYFDGLPTQNNIYLNDRSLTIVNFHRDGSEFLFATK
ncbi:MAG: hypothetical protein CMK09_11910 [Ponticaulis sp.]|nr:hypothetical protein [Ponticaulis sp.]|tara:strand:- start:17226 stop:19400 length:2175 start_codon:yes stop_codon:yes gene_type:complete